MQSPIYLDYMATTPVDPRVVAHMLPYLEQPELCGNPASSHHYGLVARRAVEIARQQVAELLNTSAETIIFTSGATEALNLAIKGAAWFHQAKGKHILTTQIEHKAVLDTCEFLANHGFDIEYLPPDQGGVITPDQVKASLRPDTILVIVMAANNEIGTLYDITTIGELVRAHGALFIVDAAQAAGKILLDCQQLKVDLLALSSHKIYGPKGIGALYISRKPRVRIAPQMHGGGHELGLRSGTLATHQIVGFGYACQLARDQLVADWYHTLSLREQFWDIMKHCRAITINGTMTSRLAYNLNLCFRGIDAEALLAGLPHLAMSTASACNSIITQASYVLKAIGLSDHEAFSSIRVSFGRYTTSAEVHRAAHDICAEAQRLQYIAPG